MGEKMIFNPVSSSPEKKKPFSSKLRKTHIQKKQKIKWSQIYSFNCLKPAGGDEQIAGQPRFSRVAFCNQPHLHTLKPHKYPGNYVSTTKYNFITFLPKALFEQFRRVANLYFLLAAILCLTDFSPFDPSSQISPLAFVVFVSMMKEAMEDWGRFKQDRKVNSRKVMVHAGDGVFVEKVWKDVRVGEIVKVGKDEYFPSDILLLASSFGDGVCYVETMNLDGETNLKFKRSLEETAAMDDDAKFSGFQARVECEDPNPDLYTFVGNLEVKAGQKLPLSPTQILLRDSKLRNTDFVYGAVIFTGPDAKAVRNSTESPSKRSRLERRLDSIIYLLFGGLVAISIINTGGAVVASTYQAQTLWYLALLANDRDAAFDPAKLAGSFFSQLVRALILYGYLIPISLYVSMEAVKVLQALFINKDERLYDESTGKGVVARTSNLNEELGQVEMILSDKTGTLTCNQMEFRKCSIEGTSYGGETTEVDLAASRRINISYEGASTSYGEITEEVDVLPSDGFRGGSFELREMAPAACSGTRTIKGFNFEDRRLLDKTWIYRSNVYEMVMFFRVLSLCHTGLPVEDGTFESESPEEVAFLVAAQEFGFTFTGRTQSLMTVVEIDPSSGAMVKREFQLLNLLEFTSARKRMSVIVRDDHGDIILLCKGADNVIFDRLGDGGRRYQSATMVHLSSYAEDGLRTLVFAYRRIGASDYEKWNQVFANAKATIGVERDGLLQAASEMIEKDLVLLGAVAVEDRLQQGVPECIDKLAQAGIKIWLLTGDKRETAVNIGFSCSLLRQDMKQFHLSLSGEAGQAMEGELVSQIRSSYEEIAERNRQAIPSALIVDGTVLEMALKGEVSNHFFRLAVKCDSVICCRVSPKQKALITRLVKEFTGKTTLAIGDGANDVGMIQEADIGVGISGAEGMQAVMASDFSLPQFRFLERLLIVHGHWCYKRIAKLILYFVYKNVTFGLTLFYHEVYTMFSGEELYNSWYMVVFNILLTSLPVIALGVLDKDVSANVCLKFPALYQQGQRNSNFSWRAIAGWIVNAVVSSLTIYSITVRMLSPEAFRRDGHTADGIHVGTFMYTCIIWTVNCQIALITSNLTWVSQVSIWGSLIAWFVYLAIYGLLTPRNSGEVYQILVEAVGSAPLFWFTTLVVVVASLLPYLVFSMIKRHFYPSDDQIIQEMKYCKKDVMDYPMWLEEQKKSKSKTDVGFSSRVDAKIQHLTNISINTSS